MRKTISLLTFFIFIFFLSFVSVKAECSYSKQTELNALASNVKYSVEPKKEKVVVPATEEEEETFYENTKFILQLLNITEDMKVLIHDDFSNKTVTYTYANTKEGILEIQSPTSDNIVKYKIDIYGSAECGSTLLRTFEVKTPMVNPYRVYANCDKAPEYYLCQEYLVENPNYTLNEGINYVKDFVTKKEKQQSEETKQEKTFFQKLGIFFQKYWIISVILILALIITLYVIFKIRKERIV